MYKQIYNLEIIEELMEAGGADGGEDKRVAFVEYQYKQKQITTNYGQGTTIV